MLRSPAQAVVRAARTRKQTWMTAANMETQKKAMVAASMGKAKAVAAGLRIARAVEASLRKAKAAAARVGSHSGRMTATCSACVSAFVGNGIAPRRVLRRCRCSNATC